jgi:hypothetical protein
MFASLRKRNEKSMSLQAYNIYDQLISQLKSAYETRLSA